MRNDPRYESLRHQAIALRRAGKSIREIKQTLRIGNNLVTELVRGEPPAEWTKRPNAKDDLRARARELRAQGRSYNEIAATLGVSKSSCSLWLRDTPRPTVRPSLPRPSAEAYRASGATRRANAEARRLQAKIDAAHEIGVLSTREVILAGAMAYWCEGAKNRPHRREDRVAFANGDPALIGFFIRFLGALGVSPDRLRFTLQIHETAHLGDALAFWQQITGGRPEQFGKSTIKAGNPATNRRNTGPEYRGCLRVAVNDGAQLYHRIEGWAAGMLARPGDGSRFGSIVEFPMTEMRTRAISMRRAGKSRQVIQDSLRIGSSEVVDGLLVGVPASPEWIRRATYSQYLEDQTRDLRAHGWGCRRIAAHLGCPRTLVEGWLRSGEEPVDQSGAEARVAGLQRYWDRFRICADVGYRLLAEEAAREVGMLSEREMRVLGAVAYWCEGGKDKAYRREERVCFVNRDPAVMRFFLRFLRVLDVERSRWNARIHIHETGDLERARHFWEGETGLDAESFRKPVIKRHVPRTRYPSEREGYHGCLVIDISRSARLYRLIEGWALGSMMGEAAARQRWLGCPDSS